MLQSQFPDVAAEAAEQQASRGFRAFVGDGTAVLRTPGLLELEAVRIGGQDVPLILEEPTLVSLVENAPPEIVQIEMFALREDAVGAYLLRSEKSNDGRWQKGEIFLVKGEFDDDERRLFEDQRHVLAAGE